MLWLKMYIGEMLLDKVELYYEGFTTVDERQTYQERCANELYFKHNKKIKLSLIEPEFYIDNVPSKMNFTDHEISWTSLIIKHTDLPMEEVKKVVQKINETPAFFINI